MIDDFLNENGKNLDHQPSNHNNNHNNNHNDNNDHPQPKQPMEKSGKRVMDSEEFEEEDDDDKDSIATFISTSHDDADDSVQSISLEEDDDDEDQDGDVEDVFDDNDDDADDDHNQTLTKFSVQKSERLQRFAQNLQLINNAAATASNRLQNGTGIGDRSSTPVNHANIHDNLLKFNGDHHNLQPTNQHLKVNRFSIESADVPTKSPIGSGRFKKFTQQKLECDSERFPKYLAPMLRRTNAYDADNMDSVRINIDNNCQNSLAKIQAQMSNGSGSSGDFSSTPDNQTLDSQSTNSMVVQQPISTQHDGQMMKQRFSPNTKADQVNKNPDWKFKGKSLLTPHRISILGKPLPKRKEISFLKQRIWIYNLLHRPKGFWATTYHLLVILTIVTGLILFALSTVDEYYQDSIHLLQIFDAVILAIFILEFCARSWSSQVVIKYQGWSGAWRFSTSTYRWIDVFIILTSAAVLYIHHVDETYRAEIDWLRFAQAFQVLRISHRFRPWKIMASVIWTQRNHLAIAVYMCSLSLVFITFTVYYVEHTQPNTDFTSIPRTLWWGIISLLTIGYGDMVPATSTGKFLSSILLLVCFSTFALPSGILGTGLALKVQEQQRQKHFHKRRDPAARLIQCAWRCYASSENSRSVAFWKACLRQKQNFNKKKNRKLAQQAATASGTLGSMVDMKLLRKFQRLVGDSQSSLVELHSRNRTETSIERFTRKQSEAINKYRDDDDPKEYFSPLEQIAIRFIRLLKFKVARKHFKNAFRPYDINDVIEHYSAGHLDVVGRVKNIQSKMNSVQNAMANVIKMCQDLNYIQYHQMDRMERTIRELNQRLESFTDKGENSKLSTPTTSTNETTEKLKAEVGSGGQDPRLNLSLNTLPSLHRKDFVRKTDVQRPDFHNRKIRRFSG